MNDPAQCHESVTDLVATVSPNDLREESEDSDTADPSKKDIEENDVVIPRPLVSSYSGELRTKDSALSMKHPQPRLGIRMTDWTPSPSPSPPGRVYMASPLQSTYSTSPSRSPMPSSYQSTGPSTMPSPFESSLNSERTRSQKSSDAFNSAPLLTRASSMMSKRSSATSPARNTAYNGGGGELGSASTTWSPSSSPLKKGRSALNMSVSSFTDMFAGSSAPMNIGLVNVAPPTKAKPLDSSGRPSSTDMFTSSTYQPSQPRHQRSSTLGAAASFLGLSSSPTRSNRSPCPTLIEEPSSSDPYLDPDFSISSNLFPATATDDPFTTLHHTAHILATSLLTAYRSKHATLQATLDRSPSPLTQSDELEESRERARHLKIQLDGMAVRVAEQDAQLATRMARIRTLRVVRPHSAARSASPDDVRMRRFFSAGSACSDSPPATPVDAKDFALQDESPWSSSDEEEGSVFERGSNAGTEASTAPSAGWRASAAPFMPPVEDLESENEGLRKRIRELEETVQGCLGLVDGL